MVSLVGARVAVERQLLSDRYTTVRGVYGTRTQRVRLIANAYSLTLAPMAKAIERLL